MSESSPIREGHLLVGPLFSEPMQVTLRALCIPRRSTEAPIFCVWPNALAVLYPKDSEEKRLVEAMLLAAPR